MTKQAVRFSFFHKTVLSVALGVFALFICAPLAPAQSYEAYPLGVYGGFADIAADNNNNLHLLWINGFTLYYGRIVNNAVSGQQTVFTLPYPEYIAITWSWPHIAVSPSGDTVHLLWVKGGNTPNRSRLYHSWRNASGAWTTETVESADYSKYYWPVCAIDANGTVHAIYGMNPGNGNCKVYYTRKPVGGGWSAPADLSYGDEHMNVRDYNSADFSEFEMSGDKNGGIHARWSLINTRYIRYRYCPNGGSLAGSPTEYVVDNNASSVGPGDLHVEENGTVHMAINAYNGYVNMDHSYKPVGAGWTAPTRPSNGSVGSTTYEIWPTMAVPRDGTGRVMVVWAEGGYHVKMAAWENQSWTHYSLDTAASMNDSWIKPAMTATDSGVYGVWRTGAAYNNSWVLGVVQTASVVPLRLTAPNGGETWDKGSAHAITWDAAGITQNVKLVLFKNGVKVGNIVEDIPAATGLYSWAVGNYQEGTAAAGTGYTVRVRTMDGVFSDDSDQPFTIAGLNLTAPNGGETWAKGAYQTVTWTAPGVTGAMKLVLFKDDVKVGNIATDITVADGSYRWLVGSYIGGTANAGSGYKIRAIDMNGKYSDYSDNTFTITGVTLTSPNGGESWPRGATRAITWTATGVSGQCKLVLFRDGVKLGNIVIDLTLGSGTYDWTVGNYIGGTAEVDDGYTVRVIDMSGTYSDYSDAGFAIYQPAQ